MSTLGKRGQAEDGQRPNKRARQREQRISAHRIVTQPAGVTNQVDSNEEKRVVKLPSQIQADKYISSYSFEIRSLQQAIKSSAQGSSIRAWQMLPRHKRRRNASHNLLALPKRLRPKGRAELKASKTTPRSRAETRRRRGKGNRLALGAYPRRRESSRRRELVERATKAAGMRRGWLETHLWHAKRFRMSAVEGKTIAGSKMVSPDRWGFTLAEESSMKSHRSTWRDEKRGASVMDASYESWIRISASVRAVEQVGMAEDALSKVLLKAGLQDGWQGEWMDGKRCCRTVFTGLVQVGDGAGKQIDDGGSSTHCRGPTRVLWLRSDDDGVPDHLRKRKELLVFTHPAAAAHLERSLRNAVTAISRGLSAKIQLNRLHSLPHPRISAGSSAAGRRHGRQEREKGAIAMDAYHDSLEKKWLRGEAFNMFELGGPKAGALMGKVLRPIHGEDSNKWDAIIRGTLAEGTVVPLDVHDPRLSFPPRMPLRKRVKQADLSSSAWPSTSRLLNHGYSPPAYRKGEIDRRRSKLATPGARLLPTSKDDVVPIVIIVGHRRPSLTLLVPRGWGQAFWLSLVNPGTRVVGQVQSHALDFDRGCPSFPFDWAGTPGFQRQEEVDSLIAFEEWQRKPPAKRCNFDKVGVRWPFGGSGLWREMAVQGCLNSGIPDLSTPSRPPWMFTSSSTISVDSLAGQYRLWKSGAAAPQTLLPFQSALICVKVTACRKGSFSRWDEIHFVDTNVANDWKVALRQVQHHAHSKSTLQKLESQPSPSSKSHIGSITTGNFSLSSGKASALASISLLAYLSILTSQDTLEAEVRGKKERNPIPLDNFVLVKTVQAGVCRPASVQAVSLS